MISPNQEVEATSTQRTVSMLETGGCLLAVGGRASPCRWANSHWRMKSSIKRVSGAVLVACGTTLVVMSPWLVIPLPALFTSAGANITSDGKTVLIHDFEDLVGLDAARATRCFWTFILMGLVVMFFGLWLVRSARIHSGLSR